MTQTLAGLAEDETCQVEQFSELARPSFEDLLVQQADVNRQLAREHDRVVEELQGELDRLRKSLVEDSLNGPAKSAWTPSAPPPQSRPPPLQTAPSSAVPTMSISWSEPVTPRGSSVKSTRGAASAASSGRNSENKAVCLTELADNSVVEIEKAESATSSPRHARPKSAGAQLGSKARDGSIIKVEEGVTRISVEASFLNEEHKKTEERQRGSLESTPSTIQFLNPLQGTKKPKKHQLSLPGKAGPTTSPDDSSDSSSEPDHVVAKSLSWAPSDGGASRKHSLAALNPLNFLFNKDEGEAPPSITVACSALEDEVVPTGGAEHRKSVGALSVSASAGGSRRPSLSANVVNMPRRKSLTANAGSNRGSRRGSRSYTAPAGSAPPPLAKAKFDPWPVWSAALDADNHEHWERISNISRHSVLVDAYRKLKSVDFTRHGNSDGLISWAFQKLVMHPSSLKRMLWVALSGILITYDIIMTPLRVFDIEETGFVQALNWVTMFFWTFDLLMSPFVGYHHQFNLELRVKKTAFRYVTTWFAFDMLLVSSDWILIFFGAVMGDKGVEGARTLRTAKTFRMARALRSLRLLRVVKMPEIIKDTTYLVGRSEYTSLTLGILKHVFGILLVNHLIACLWYVVGDTKHGWVREYCRDCSVHMLYFTSLHWSLTQFTPATMSVQPQNFGERIYAVSVLMFALITFSSFVSSITNLMTHLRTLRSVEAKQYVKLERYLHDRGISFHLSIRVRRYLEHVLSERARHLEETDIELLKKLSTPLHMELRYEVHYPVLSKHPFFKHLAICNLQVMQRLCLEVIKSLHVGAGDSLFCVGDSAHSMYFIERGMMLYSKQAAFSLAAAPEMMDSGSWCCEAVLWTPWEHRGEMRALTEANLLALQATKFHEIMSKNKTASQQPAAYAAEVVDALNALDRGELSDVDNAQQAKERVVMVKDAFEIDDESEAESTHPDKHQANLSHVFTKMAHKVVTVTGHRGSGGESVQSVQSARSSLSTR